MRNDGTRTSAILTTKITNHARRDPLGKQGGLTNDFESQLDQ